jgi:hypothetical protein
MLANLVLTGALARTGGLAGMIEERCVCAPLLVRGRTLSGSQRV